ncbi:hypothetical protein TNCV_1055681 [Trichonephila clavipes]|nr:hypothetical protein TNCV_1055681 [Trichonephila clavipes]
MTIILRLTRYWFGKSINAFIVSDLKVNKNNVGDWYMFCREVCMIAWCIHHPKKTDHKCKQKKSLKLIIQWRNDGNDTKFVTSESEAYAWNIRE